MRLLFALPWWVTISWVVLALWAVMQVVWYRRVYIVVPPPPRRRESATPGETAPRPAMTTVLPTGGSPEFLAELGLDEPTASESPGNAA